MNPTWRAYNWNKRTYAPSTRECTTSLHWTVGEWSHMHIARAVVFVTLWVLFYYKDARSYECKFVDVYSDGPQWTSSCGSLYIDLCKQKTVLLCSAWSVKYIFGSEKKHPSATLEKKTHSLGVQTIGRGWETKNKAPTPHIRCALFSCYLKTDSANTNAISSKANQLASCFSLRSRPLIV